MPIPNTLLMEVAMFNELSPTKGRPGHTNHTGGYSLAYSWWRVYPSFKFMVCGHDAGFCHNTQYAITDDFGNLVPAGDLSS
jgi:hypothetical protein